MIEAQHARRSAREEDLLFPIDRASPETIHAQIHGRLKRLIAERTLSAGVFLPSEGELAELWQVARGTVRRAITQLVDEGLVERRPGKGTWVASFKIQQLLGHLTSFSEDMRSRGLEPTSELLSIENVVPGLGAQQLFGEGSPMVWKVVRRRFANELPIAVETSLIRGSLVERSELERSAGGSLYELYRSAGIRPHRAVQLVEAVNLPSELAELLGVKPGTAAFKQERISYCRNDRVFEVVESYYRGDLYKLQVELRDPV